MSQKTILTLPGDGPGASFVRRAAELMGLLVPDLEILEAQYGRTSWEYTNEVLPPETEDAIADVDCVLCGPCDVSSIGKRDPVRTIITYNNLTVRAVEYIGLPRLCPGGLDACVVSPVHSVTRQFKEMDSLDGVDSTYFTVADDAGDFFRHCVDLARRRGRTRIRHVATSEIFPHASKMSRSVFKEVMRDYDVEYDDVNLTTAMEILTTKPVDAGMFVGGPVACLPIRGAACGISGGEGLMADTFIGNDLALYMPCIENPEAHRNNPTATILAASNLLLDLGYRDECRILRDAVRRAYMDRTSIKKSNNAFDRQPDELFSSVIGHVNMEDEPEDYFEVLPEDES